MRAVTSIYNTSKVSTYFHNHTSSFGDHKPLATRCENKRVEISKLNKVLRVADEFQRCQREEPRTRETTSLKDVPAGLCTFAPVVSIWSLPFHHLCSGASARCSGTEPRVAGRRPPPGKAVARQACRRAERFPPAMAVGLQIVTDEEVNER